MSTKVYKTTFKLRRGTLSEWASKNPVLQLGEPGFVTDLNKLKIGNGEDAWNDLPYLTGSGGGGISVLEHSLIIGEQYFDGSRDVIVPIYKGDMTEEEIIGLLESFQDNSVVTQGISTAREKGMSELKQFNLESVTPIYQLKTN